MKFSFWERSFKQTQKINNEKKRLIVYIIFTSLSDVLLKYCLRPFYVQVSKLCEENWWMVYELLLLLWQRLGFFECRTISFTCSSSVTIIPIASTPTLRDRIHSYLTFPRFPVEPWDSYRRVSSVGFLTLDFLCLLNPPSTYPLLVRSVFLESTFRIPVLSLTVHRFLPTLLVFHG